MSCCATCAVPDNGAMKLELVTVQRGGRSKYAAPFDDHCGYTPGWWNRPMGEGDRTQFIQVLRDGPEVARVELDEVVGIDHYARVPPLGERALEIQFIEVKDEERRLGIGTEVVRALIARYPNPSASRVQRGWGAFGHPWVGNAMNTQLSQSSIDRFSSSQGTDACGAQGASERNRCSRRRNRGPRRLLAMGGGSSDRHDSRVQSCAVHRPATLTRLASKQRAAL